MAIDQIENIIELYKRNPYSDKGGEPELRAYLENRMDNARTPEQKKTLEIQLNSLETVMSTPTYIFGSQKKIISFLEETTYFTSSLVDREKAA